MKPFLSPANKLCRDSLGASKKEDRQIIKSKAFTAKINALEVEKQEITKRNKGKHRFHSSTHTEITAVQ
jgi:hypothetical protein